MKNRMDGEAEIPQYFICPISLQIMTEPVTAFTGITYDRESIEQWLSSASTCPVTNQHLPRDSVLTPNHTLHRLIQAWRAGGPGFTVSPKPSSIHVIRNLVRDLQSVPHLRSRALRELAFMAARSEQHRKCMGKGGAIISAVASSIEICFKENDGSGVEDAVRILSLVWGSADNKPQILVNPSCDFMGAVMGVLRRRTGAVHAVKVLKSVIEGASSSFLQLLKPEFFEGLVAVVGEKRLLPRQAVLAALHTLNDACTCGRNPLMLVEAGGVFELVELLLWAEKPEKRIAELALNLLAQVCTCADGRAKFLGHAGGVAVVTKRLLRVSAAADEAAVKVLEAVAKFSATNEVVSEMLRVGAVSKLCMVLQADCAVYLKDKARGILRMHYNVWNDSPCIAVYLLTRNPR